MARSRPAAPHGRGRARFRMEDLGPPVGHRGGRRHTGRTRTPRAATTPAAHHHARPCRARSAGRCRPWLADPAHFGRLALTGGGLGRRPVAVAPIAARWLGRRVARRRGDRGRVYRSPATRGAAARRSVFQSGQASGPALRRRGRRHGGARRGHRLRGRFRKSAVDVWVTEGKVAGAVVPRESPPDAALRPGALTEEAGLGATVLPSAPHHESES